MLVKISDDCYVAADHIAEVKIYPHAASVAVRTKDGAEHCHAPKYCEGVYAALDRLAAEINATTTKEQA